MRKFAVIMDDSKEFLNALRYAAIRAKKTGAGVVIISITTPGEMQHWLGVDTTMREEARERAEAHFEVFRKWMIDAEEIEPEHLNLEGDQAKVIMETLREHKEISVLVLGAAHDRKGPGPLVQQLVSKQGGEMPIPITIVPGNLSKDDIIAIA